jgi:hypothetical protein
VTYSPSSPRQPGELPADREPLGAVFSSKERREQRRLVRYFERLALALDDGEAFANWETSGDAAQACRAVLGEDEATELAERLAIGSRNVLDVAEELGYREAEA